MLYPLLLTQNQATNPEVVPHRDSGAAHIILGESKTIAFNTPSEFINTPFYCYCFWAVQHYGFISMLLKNKNKIALAIRIFSLLAKIEKLCQLSPTTSAQRSGESLGSILALPGLTLVSNFGELRIDNSVMDTVQH